MQKLGVTMSYLTPVFASKSNHAYDVEDFTHVDPAFGGDAGLATLLSQAHRLGIRVILDLPFDPSSSDSPYFDRYHHYRVTGACEDPKSPYRSWFTLHDLPVGITGPCGVEQPGRYATYDGWGGTVDTLPLFRKKDWSDPVEVFSPIGDYFTVARIRSRIGGSRSGSTESDWTRCRTSRSRRPTGSSSAL
ncbi:MAG: alpha-amylase family glycosyl hydrolase [Pseudonocardiaceae bacterium]